MSDIAVSVLILLGSFFMVTAALGVLRMPDLLIRMHAATKAGALGAILLVIAAAVAYHDMGITVRCLAIVAFICLIAPVVAHVVGRLAYFWLQVHLWEGTTIVEVPQDPEQTAK